MTSAAASILSKLRDIRFVRYVLASVGALAVDVGSFLALLAIGVMAAPASAIGYSLGILAHWLMSSRAVFVGDVAERGAAIRDNADVRMFFFIDEGKIGHWLFLELRRFGLSENSVYQIAIFWQQV